MSTNVLRPGSPALNGVQVAPPSRLRKIPLWGLLTSRVRGSFGWAANLVKRLPGANGRVAGVQEAPSLMLLYRPPSASA